MIRNHGIVPKKSKSAHHYYSTHKQPDNTNYCLQAAIYCFCFVLALVSYYAFN
jgi:hypothetical protein